MRFLSSAEGHDRTYGTNILKIIFEGTKKARNVANCYVFVDCMVLLSSEITCVYHLIGSTLQGSQYTPKAILLR